YTLLLFWSADCSHCVETVNALFPWSQQPENKTKVSVIAISLDETETEIKAWQQKAINLTGWKHLRAKEGVRSKVASDYYVLATPVMILLDSKTKEIVALPETTAQVEAVMH
ncbi:MAG: thioredoxin family protein, partial [Bacteroidales bacterium]